MLWYTPVTPVARKVESGVQYYPKLSSKFQASLGYRRHHLKKNNEFLKKKKTYSTVPIAHPNIKQTNNRAGNMAPLGLMAKSDKPKSDGQDASIGRKQPPLASCPLTSIQACYLKNKLSLINNNGKRKICSTLPSHTSL